MTLLVLFLVTVQAGATAPSRDASPPREPLSRPVAVCSGVRVTAPQQAAQPRNLVFSSRQVLDLQLHTQLRRDLQGEHLLQLRVLTPNGFLYQVITVPFVSSAPAAGPTGSRDSSARRAREATSADAPPPPRYVPGFPRPLPVQRLVPVAGDATARVQYQLEARLPVAGTSITMSSLYGRWTVQPYLDGETAPCGPATRFTIRE